jgi:AGZA family xanthine/uracil permease-like MFS transporter
MAGTVGPVYSFSGAMCIVFLSGLLVVLVVVSGLRDKVFDGIPSCVRSAIPVGIGLFIGFIGFSNSKIVVSDAATMVTSVAIRDMYTDPVKREQAFNALVCLIGLFTILILEHYNIKGSILFGFVLLAFFFYFKLRHYICNSYWNCFWSYSI